MTKIAAVYHLCQTLLCLTLATVEKIVLEADIPAYRAYNRAVSFQGQGQLDSALRSYFDALTLKPNLSEALLNIGNLWQHQGKGSQARLYYEEAYQGANTASSKADALNNLAHLSYLEAGSDFASLEAMLPAAEAAVLAAPEHIDAWYNLGRCYESLGRWSEACTAFARVLRLDASYPSAHLSLSHYYLLRRDYPAALKHLKTITEDARSNTEVVTSALNNLGQLYRLMRDYAKAMTVFQESLEYTPGSLLPLSNIMVTARSLCQWDRLQEVQEHVLRLAEAQADGHSPPASQTVSATLPPYDAMLIPNVSISLQRRLAIAHTAQWHNIRRCQLRLTAPSPALRVTYLSYDFRDHVMGHLTQGLLTYHNRTRFQTQAASYGPADKSETRRKLEQSADIFTDVAALGDLRAACVGISQAFQPHILVDLMGVTTGTRPGIAALKPAPVTVNYLGYPGTMGATYMDYAIGDKVVAPPETAQEAFVERLVLLSDTYQANNFQPTVPLKSTSTIHRFFRFCNFNHADKLEPISFSTWLSILHNLPSSTLSLLAPTGPSADLVASNLYREATIRGIATSRIIFLPRLDKADHLERIHDVCDLFLDSFIYGAHTTAADALFAGVPLLTLVGYSGAGDTLGPFQARVGASLLRVLGMESMLVVHSPREMIQVAVEIAQKQNVLYRSIVKRLRRAVTTKPAFDTRAATANLERAYEAMWELHAIGYAPQHLVVHADAFTPAKLLGLAKAHEEQLVARLLEELTSEDKKLAAALAISTRLLAGFPASADASHLHGLALLHLDRVEEAKDHIDHATRLRPDVAFFHLNLAEALLRLGRRQQAQEALERCLAIDIREGGAAVKLQSILCERGAYAEAIDMFESFSAQLLSHSRGEIDSYILPLLQQHAFACVQIGNWADAILALQKLLQMRPNDYRAAFQLANALEGHGQAEMAIQQFLAAVRLKHSMEFTPTPLPVGDRTTEGTQNGVLRLAIYCDEYGQSWWGQWGPSSLEKGLGGSEESVVFMSRELAKTGHFHVQVYANPAAHDVGRDAYNVFWLPYQSYDPAHPADIFISWRYPVSLALAETATNCYLWLQDVIDFTILTPHFLESHVTGILVPSNFHASLLPPYAKNLVIVTSNALDRGYLFDGPNHNWIFAYGSAPYRGLESLLRIWPEIRERVEQTGRLSAKPELRVYYGFTSAVEQYMRRQLGSTEAYNAWRSRMDILLRQEGVRFYGLVNHTTLAQEFAVAGFLLYPTFYPETSCVTLMKAQAMGCVPITSSFPGSAVPETAGAFDLGPQIPVAAEAGTNTAWLRLYVDAVVSAVELDQTQLSKHRYDMKMSARRRFDWGQIALQWTEAFRVRQVAKSK